ncbi:MAG: hypothetical protein BWY19_00351 [bacterium ADurb.Bin212]|nr:MAG: hypothetical protein BWY19_00351 [bacterium ADurb.Bin212]
MQMSEIALPPHLLEALQMVEVALSGNVPKGQCLVVLENGTVSRTTNEEEAA